MRVRIPGALRPTCVYLRRPAAVHPPRLAPLPCLPRSPPCWPPFGLHGLLAAPRAPCRSHGTRRVLAPRLMRTRARVPCQHAPHLPMWRASIGPRALCRSARHAPTPRHMAALAPPAVADAPCSPTHPRALPQPRHVPRLPTPHFAPRALTRSPLVYAADGGRQAACGVWGAVGSVCWRAGGQASRLGGKWLQRDC